MKPIKTVILAAALSLAASGAMAQSATQQKTQSDMNPAVGDGSSGGKNPGAQDKLPGKAPTYSGSGASMNSGTTGANSQHNDKSGNTGSSQMDQKKN